MRSVPIALASLLVGLLLLCPVPGRAQEPTPLALPPPQMEGGTPLMATTMQLRPEQQIMLAQSVGYPKR
jgi:hypothetical protein